MKGLNALLAVVSTPSAASIIAAARLRKGSTNSARGAQRFVTDALDTEEKAKRAQPPAARGAQRGAWLPVPVPPPIYLSAPPAPRRRARLKAEDEAAVTQEPSVEDVTAEQRAVND